MSRFLLDSSRYSATPQKDGKLKINKLAIALEAGHSRTTYVNHPDINKFIEEQLEEAAKPAQVTAFQANKSLREDNARLKLEKAILATKLADLTRYAAKLERDLGKANTKLQRLERSDQASPNRVIGRTVSDDEDNVIPFPNPNE